MITRDDKLEIFENFGVDFRLPKFQKHYENGTQPGAFNIGMGTLTIGASSFSTGSSVIINNSSFWGQAQSAQSGFMVQLDSKPTLWGKIKALFGRSEPKPLISVQEFFKSIKNSAAELEIVAKRADGYEAQIKKASEAGQDAMVEQLRSALQGVRAEAQLEAMKTIKYLDEDTVVQFVKKAPKGLRLDWIKNFTRVIPENVLTAKKEADDRQVFDNYVIMHYDPAGKSWAETEAEKAKRKDPILFGVIQGRRRLYYVGDWVDEFCDLTLDKIVDALGAEAVKELQ